MWRSTSNTSKQENRRGEAIVFEIRAASLELDNFSFVTLHLLLLLLIVLLLLNLPLLHGLFHFRHHYYFLPKFMKLIRRLYKWIWVLERQISWKKERWIGEVVHGKNHTKTSHFIAFSGTKLPLVSAHNNFINIIVSRLLFSRKNF